MSNIFPSKRIHSIEDARNLARKRMPRMMFDFVDGASGDENYVKITVKRWIRLDFNLVFSEMWKKEKSIKVF